LETNDAPAGEVTLPPATIAGSYAHGWEMLKRFWPQLLLISVLLFLVILAGTIVELAWGRNESAAAVGSTIQFFYSLLVAGPFQVGALYAFVKAARGERPHVDDLFSAFRLNYRSAVIAPVLVSLLTLAGLFLLVLPGIYVAVRLAFVPFLVVDEGLGPIEAVVESWRRTEGRFWTMLGGGLFGVFAIWVGLILLLVGIIPAAMWVGLAYATFYASASRDHHRAAG
jgi:uncharacterized membrane protein